MQSPQLTLISSLRGEGRIEGIQEMEKSFFLWKSNKSDDFY